jgi:transposase
VIARVPADQLIFVDETGSHIDLARLYAWAPCGQRAYATKPRNRGRALTMIGAIGVEGLLATMTVEGGTDGDVFRSYVDQVLAPQLRPGQVVIMDNLKAHKVAGIREAITLTGAHLQYLPPYSPELSPMELAWSKLKTGLRARAARTRQALEEAWTEVLPLITPRDARQWFAHCGYCTAPN